MKNQQQPLISIAGLVSLLLITTSTAMARSTPVTVQNDASNPVPVEEISSKRHFVGVSTEKMHATTGIHFLSDICNSEYPGSSMCTTAEFANSSVKPEKSDFAWIRPVIVPLPLLSGQFLVVVDKTTGLNTSDQAFNSLNCEGWDGNTNSSGIIANQEGEFRITASCGAHLPVMCCSSQ